ncbi:hypothetical protein EKO04_010160 [Ascochyta lentis]|uniref:Starter acyltransferase (SAT) domain-containing protein n=1 Tax=Ascochyta lentis TaxID=205686 RepID=A0A8H7IW58_9PLEO|nr:hypothetical protein EKO04_010160 [Ascochyta lentis]
MVLQKLGDAQRILVFGDSTIENKLPIIQEETQKLASHEGSLFLHCIDVLEVAEVYAEADEPDELIASVLALVARFGALVLDLERDDNNKRSVGPVSILGFCTGLLAGAVAACAEDMIKVFDLACEVLAISFRLVVALVRRSKAIEPNAGLWATTFIRISKEELEMQLEDYNLHHGLSQDKKAYIGMSSQSWNSVFAPPSVIRHIARQCPILSQISQVPTTAAMAVHASHLSRPDVNWILGSLPGLETPVLPDRLIVSTSTGKPFLAKTLRELIQSIIADISMNILDIDGTIHGICSGLDMTKPVVISAMGPSPNIPALTRRLASGGVQLKTFAVIAGDRPRRVVPRRPSSSGYSS